MDKGRKYDLNDLSKQPQTKEVKDAIGKIKGEQADGWKRSARESLIKETRAGRADNTRDISDEIIKHKEELGKTSFFFDIPDYIR